MKSRLKHIMIAAGAIAILGTGCQTACVRKEPMISKWQCGNFKQAAIDLGNFADKQCGTNDLIDWHQEAALAFLASGDLTNSSRHLDIAASEVERYEDKAKYSVGDEFLSILTNQQNLPYKGRSHEKIMLYTYRALNDLAAGEVEKARPELNHAYQCQQDAVEANNRRIEAAQEKYKQREDTEREKMEEAKKDPQITKQQEDMAKDLEGFKFYADYVNPFTVYLHGLYFLHAGMNDADVERARKSLSRVVEVVGSNKCVQADLKLAENGGNNTTPITYVIFETGRAANLTQVKFSIPFVFKKNNKVEKFLVPVAFPKLVFHTDYAPELTIKAGEVTETTALVANMDSIVALDFKNEWPVILTKTMISTAIKFTTQAACENIYARLGVIVFQEASTIADTRSWETLPKECQVAQVMTPADRKLVLSTPGTAPVDVTVADGTVNVVYVKSVVANSPLNVSQFKLK